MQSHFRHHARFYVVGAARSRWWDSRCAWRGSPIALVAAGDVFFVAYLVSAAYVASRATPKGLRKYAAYDDEGVAADLPADLRRDRGLGHGDLPAAPPDGSAATRCTSRSPWRAFRSGWFTLHTLLAFRYAHLYYASAECADGASDARGLDFHGRRSRPPWTSSTTRS